MRKPFLRRPLYSLLCVAALLAAYGCANRSSAPQEPRLEQMGSSLSQEFALQLNALLPADAVLLGEQHDAPEHQQIERQVVAYLASRGLLAAVALEMADVGVSTAALKPSAIDAQAKDALKWNDKGWPWAAYGPAVMAAVRAGVPVIGANLPRSQMADAMSDAKFDAQLPGPALKAQQQLIRIGHCHLLPESQITPMTRIQIAKDVTMANTLSQAVLPGKVVVLLSGSGHAERNLGVPQHLPSDLKAKAVRLRAGNAPASERAEAFDSVWVTSALPEKDHCVGLRERLGNRAVPAP